MKTFYKNGMIAHAKIKIIQRRKKIFKKNPAE